MPPNEFVLQLVNGQSRDREYVLREDEPSGTLLTVGTQGVWCVQDASIAPVHVVLARRGPSLFARAQGNQVAHLNGQVLGNAWTEVPAFAHLVFGRAQITITKRPSRRGAERTSKEENTVLDGTADELLAALLEREGPASALPVAETVVPEGPAKGFDPYRTMIIPPNATALPEPSPPSMAPSRIVPSIGAPPRSLTLVSEGASLRPAASLSPRAQAAPPSFRHPPSPPSRIVPSLAPVRMAGTVTTALPVVSVSPSTGGIARSTASSAPNPHVQDAHKKDWSSVWKTWPPVRKVTVLLAVPTLIVALFLFREQGAHASSSPADASAIATASSSPEAPAEASNAVIPAKSAPSVDVPRAALEGGPTAGRAPVLSAAPSASVAPPTSIVPSGARSKSTKSPERVALDAAAEGAFDVAAERYDTLAAQHPENVTYREAVRILRGKSRRSEGR